MTLASPPLAPPPLWRTCVLMLLVPLLLGGLAWGLWQHWQQAERARRAPLIFDLAVRGCTLSPGGRYMTVDSDDLEYGQLLDTHTGTRVQVPLPADLPQRGRSLWLQAEIRFAYSQWTKTEIGGSTVYVPQNGWLLDVANQVVTDVLTLDPAARQAVLDLAAQRDAARLTDTSRERSTDGRYVYLDVRIYPTRHYATEWAAPLSEGAFAAPPRNTVAVPGRGSPGCNHGWRPDSSGYYFVDRTRVGLLGVGPGPIRLLLVDPPPRPWMQYAPGVGTALLLALLGWWGWRRRPRHTR